MLGKLFHKHLSLDKEMKLHGFGNTISACGLGFPSHIALSNSAFHYISGGVGRISTATLCIIMASIYKCYYIIKYNYIFIFLILLLAFYFAGPTLQIIGYFPRSLLSGAFIYMSIDFLKDTLWSSFFECDIIDYLIIWIIMISGALLDISYAIIIGLVLAFLVFIYKSSKSNYILVSSDFIDIPTNIVRTCKLVYI